MRTYTVTEYEMSDYDEYKENITIDNIIDSLEYVKRGYISDYNYTGEEDDFEVFKIHMAIRKVVELLKEMKTQ